MSEIVHTSPFMMTEHGKQCYCGRDATWHVAYKNGCGNVCNTHELEMRRIKGSVVSHSLSRDYSQLRRHVQELHPRMVRMGLPRSNADLSRLHAREHHHTEGPLSNHTHGLPGQPPMGDPTNRPDGWYTGKNATRRTA